LYICIVPIFISLSHAGGCKHLRLGLVLCTQRGSDLEGERQRIAHSIVESGSYVIDGNLLVVPSREEHVFNLLDMSTSKCSCVAHSQGLQCVCVLVAASLGLSAEEVNASPEMEVTAGPSPVSPPAHCEPTLPQKLKELCDWAESEAYQDIPGLETLINRAHAKVFSNFRQTSRKKKITPLQPWRKTVSSDHSTYSNQSSRSKRSRKSSAPNFKAKTSSTLVKKAKRAKGIGELY
jgi:hypothetical protein